MERVELRKIHRTEGHQWKKSYVPTVHGNTIGTMEVRKCKCGEITTPPTAKAGD